jgi:hypothetical protein
MQTEAERCYSLEDYHAKSYYEQVMFVTNIMVIRVIRVNCSLGLISYSVFFFFFGRGGGGG